MASEIRNMAIKSNGYSNKIKDIVKDIQNKIEQITNEMQNLKKIWKFFLTKVLR